MQLDKLKRPDIIRDTSIIELTEQNAGEGLT